MTSDYLAVVRHFSRNIRLFFVTSVLLAFAWDGIWTVLFNLYVLRLGFGPELVGSANAAGALFFAALALPAGALGARWSNRNCMILGVVLTAVAFALMPLAEFLPMTARPAWLVSIVLLAWGAMALYLVNGLPFMMDATEIEERSHVFSVHIALGPAAAFTGNLLGGMLPGLFAGWMGVAVTDPAAYRYPLWLAALLVLPAIGVLLRTRSNQEPRAVVQVAESCPLPYGLILAMALIMTIRFGGRGAVSTFFNVYLDGQLNSSTALIGTLYASAQLVSVPAALVAPLLVARWGTMRTILWSIVGIAVCTLPLAFLPHWAPAGIGYVGCAAFFTLSTGPIRLFSQELVAPRWRSAMAAAFMLGAGAGLAVAAWAGGRLVTLVGYGPLFLAGAGLMVASGVLFWLEFRPPRGQMTTGADGRRPER